MILFIDNGANHILYEKIISRLLDIEIPAGLVYFSKFKHDNSPIPSRYKFFVNINDGDVSVDAKRIISAIESSNPDFRFNECISVDRILSKLKYEESEQILLRFTAHFHQLLEVNDVTCILGEISWGMELLAYHISMYRGIKYANPLNIYAFNKPRLTFFDNKNSIKYIKQISESNVYSDGDFEIALKGREKSDINKTLGKQLRKSSLDKTVNRLKQFTANIYCDDYRYSLSFKKNRLLFSINRSLLNLFGRFIWKSHITDNTKFALLPLHVQPEATPDIVAHQFSNQLELARQIASSLPLGVKLLVKEHPNAVGCRSVINLLRYGRLPNTILVDPSCNMQELMSKANVVISIAGTAVMEAALIGIPAIVMSDIYFSDFHGVKKVTSYFELRSAIHEALHDRLIEDNRSKNIPNYQMLFNGSYDCFIHHPIIIDGVLDESNLTPLVEAIDRFAKLRLS